MTAAIVIVLLMASVMLMASVSVPVKAIDSWGLPYPSNAATLQPSSGAIPTGQTASITITPVPYLSFEPNPIGVGQMLLVNVFMTPPLNTERYFEDYLVKIQKPDGTIVTVGPFDAYIADTSGWFNYVPDAAGTWKFQFVMQGMYFPAGRYLQYRDITGRTRSYIVTNTSGTLRDSAYYNPVSTAWQELTVQQDPVMSWYSPLPTDYWTQPVSSNNREWAQIMCDFPWVGPGGGKNFPANTNLYGSNYEITPYCEAPNTAHIAWYRQVVAGGIVGSNYPTMPIRSYGSGESTYAGWPDIIWFGRCYQSMTKVFDGVTQSVWECYDLRTGEVYWDKPNVSVVPDNIEYAGSSATLIAISTTGNDTLIKYNPMTGAMTGNYSIYPLTSGNYYKNGYALTLQTITTPAPTHYQLINWTTTGTSATLASRIVSNISFPLSSISNYDFEAGIGARESTTAPNGTGVAGTVRLECASLTTGALLCNVTAGDGGLYPYSGAQQLDHGKFTDLIAGYFLCWDATSGKLLYTSEMMAYPWGAASFGSYELRSGYGMYYWQGYDGVYGFDWDTGKIVWHNWGEKGVPFEYPYGNASFALHPWGGSYLADGKVFASNGEHSPTQPVSRGWKLYAMNATTGETIWSIAGALDVGGISNGYIMTQSRYDGRQYCFGKGLSATTVSAPMTAVPLGSSVLIEGTVLDQSPGQPGTPCVSAESMSTQMEYLHMQMPIDGYYHNITMTGVPVTIVAIDSSGQSTVVGTATSNAYYGTFALNWTAPKEDKWTISAIFAGDDSYGSSTAGTSLLVGPAPAPIEFPPTTQPTDYSMTLNGILVAVVVAIIIGIVAVLLALRKK